MEVELYCQVQKVVSSPSQEEEGVEEGVEALLYTTFEK